MKTLLIYSSEFKENIDEVLGYLQEAGFFVCLHRYSSHSDLKDLFDDIDEDDSFVKIISAGSDALAERVFDLMRAHDINASIGHYGSGSIAKQLGLPMEVLSRTEKSTSRPAATRNVNNNAEDFESGAAIDEDSLRVNRNNNILKEQTRYMVDRNLHLIDCERPRPQEEKITWRRLGRDFLEIVKEAPKHRFFHYANKDSLSKAYFASVLGTMNEPYIYLVLSNTGSPAGNIIGRMSRRKYNHISLSFDAALTTMVSYNGGNRVSPPGQNHELLHFLRQKSDASVMIYRLRVSRSQKMTILREVRRINKKGSAYNVVGLVLRRSFVENIQLCSEFVYNILKKAGVRYFDKAPSRVMPTDFVELDYKRVLEFYNECYVEELL